MRANANNNMALDDERERLLFGSGFVAVGELSSWHLKLNRGLFFPRTPLWRTAVARGTVALRLPFWDFNRSASSLQTWLNAADGFCSVHIGSVIASRLGGWNLSC